MTGLRVIGIKTYVGERKSFLISLAEPDGDPSTFTFEAECKWTGTENEENAPVGGFKITSIGEEDFEENSRSCCDLWVANYRRLVSPSF